MTNERNLSAAVESVAKSILSDREKKVKEELQTLMQQYEANMRLLDKFGVNLEEMRKSAKAMETIVYRVGVHESDEPSINREDPRMPKVKLGFNGTEYSLLLEWKERDDWDAPRRALRISADGVKVSVNSKKFDCEDLTRDILFEEIAGEIKSMQSA